jgi:hypothetical protein
MLNFAECFDVDGGVGGRVGGGKLTGRTGKGSSELPSRERGERGVWEERDDLTREERADWHLEGGRSGSGPLVARLLPFYRRVLWGSNW